MHSIVHFSHFVSSVENRIISVDFKLFSEFGTTEHQRQNVVLPFAEAVGASYVEYINISEHVKYLFSRQNNSNVGNLEIQ